MIKIKHLTDRFLTRWLSPRVWHLAWPLILSNITVPLLGLVDAAVLGHLPSPVYLAAVALGGQLFTTLFWLFGFLRMGTSGLSAQAFGGGREVDAARLLWRGMGLGALLGCLLILTGPLLIPAGLAALQAEGAVLDEAGRYASVRLWGAPWVMVQYACMGWLVGRQRMRAVMGVAILANSVNVVLDLILVLGLGMTTAGVALATVVADICGTLLALHATWRALPGHPRLARPWKQLLDMEPVRELIRVNQHLFVRTALLLFTFGFFNAQSARLGDVTLAANAILLTGLLVISNALDGFAHAAEALSGEAAGRQDPAAIRNAAVATGRSALTVAVLLTLLFAAGGDTLISLLTSLPDVRQTALDALPWLICLPLVGVWSYWFDGLFVGLGWTARMRTTLVIATLGVFLPLWWLTRGWGNPGLWLSLTAFLAARGAIQATYWLQFSTQPLNKS